MPHSIGSMPVGRFLGFCRARFETPSNRALLCMAIAATLAVGAAAATPDCDAVADDERPLCRIMARCEALTDHDAKTECLRTAEALGAMLRDDPAEPVSAVAPVDAASEERPRWRRWLRLPGRSAPVQPAVAESAPAPAMPPDAKQEPEHVAPPAPPPARAGEAVGPEVAITQTVVDRTVFEIPGRFEGVVTAFRRLVRDRQLIAVDDRLLFLGDVADESNIEVGDAVLVRRTSRMFGGERYIITGPSERSVSGRRILCERIELNKVNRSRCANLVGVRAETE